jgi:hypothetical protein
LRILSNLADDLSKEQRWKEAIQCQEQTVEGMEFTYGVDHKFTTTGLRKLEELRNHLNDRSAIDSQDLVPPASLGTADGTFTPSS